uniref:Sec39 domain-containing protein n=1 Tax=Timema monikensis TaxID=170555 RepID=A0A7R9HM63_9NEOP|nr:unnamed protein product [Timema monikensis]
MKWGKAMGSMLVGIYHYIVQSSRYTIVVCLQLITHVAQIIEASQTGDTHPCWPLLLKYQGLLEDYLQGERLQALGCGVDLQRFTFDSEYQRDTILGLAMTEEDDKFQLAVELGSRHNVSASEIAARHVTSLLLQGGDTARLATKLADSRLNQLLKSDSEQACSRLEENIYPNMDGRDHQSLGLYFTLLGRVAPDSPVHSLLPREHLRLLHKVKATSADIDYKLLVEPNADVLKGLEPVLTKDNVGMVAKLLKSLSHSSVQPGALYGVLAQKEFFQSLGERLTNAECLRLIERCATHFSKMTAADMVSFVQGTCFSERAAELMNTGCRRALLIRAVELCEDDALRLRGDQRAQQWELATTLNSDSRNLQQLSTQTLGTCNNSQLRQRELATTLNSDNGNLQQLFNSDSGNLQQLSTQTVGTCNNSQLRQWELATTLNSDSGNLHINGEEWAFGIATLRRWLNHLETISSRLPNDQSSTGSADFKHLYRLLDISRGEPDSVREVMKRAVHSSIPLTFVQLLLTLPPGTPPTLEKLLGDLLHEAMVSPRLESESVLSAVLRRLQEVASLEQRDASAVVWRQLEPLCGDLSLSPGVRLQALTLVQTLNQSPEDSTTKLLYHHAQALVATGWPDTVITLQESDLATESARYDLFQRLLAHAESWGHFTTLAQLLQEWPHFCEVSPSPWTTFISKLIRQGDLESENVATLLENILEGNVLSAQDVECVVVDCEETVEHSLLLLVCLLPKHPSLHVLAVSLIHSHNTSIEGDLTPRVLALLLNRGLLASVVGTPVYPQLIESALSGDKAPTIDKLVDQLLSAGCEPEASMLRFLHLGVPPSLTTFSAALAALRSK